MSGTVGLLNSMVELSGVDCSQPSGYSTAKPLVAHTTPHSEKPASAGVMLGVGVSEGDGVNDGDGLGLGLGTVVIVTALVGVGAVFARFVLCTR